MIRIARNPHNRLEASMLYGMLGLAVLIACLGGPFLVQCRAANGLVSARILFSPCAQDAGCCDGVTATNANPAPEAGLQAELQAGPQAGPEAGLLPQLDACTEGACGGCSEATLFHFVHGSGTRDESLVVTYLPVLFSCDHPTETTRALPGANPAWADGFEGLMNRPGEVHRVLRI